MLTDRAVLGAYRDPMRKPGALLAVLLLMPSPMPAQEGKLTEKMTVERIVVDARVTDDVGDPIMGLTPADFRARIDGKLAEIESVDWVSESEAARDLQEIVRDAAPESTMKTPPPEGRLLVFFFQTDFARAPSHLAGEMHVMPFADKLLEFLEEEDRVAVLSFDSHLKFRTDFTNDKEVLSRAMRDALQTDNPPWPPLVHSPALRSFLSEKDAKNAASSERALLLLGNALAQIPGPKTLVLFGWGLGRLSGGRVEMTRDYGPARIALDRSRTTLFALDTSDADFHSLEVGLGKAAEDTGGFYLKTNKFADYAIDRLSRTLRGRYELVLRRPAGLRRGGHDIVVEVLKHREARVFAKSGFVDKD
jgi:VWFA-related protein